VVSSAGAAVSNAGPRSARACPRAASASISRCADPAGPTLPAEGARALISRESLECLPASRALSASSGPASNDHRRTVSRKARAAFDKASGARDEG
jgi:hypothetical protein